MLRLLGVVLLDEADYIFNLIIAKECALYTYGIALVARLIEHVTVSEQ